MLINPISSNAQRCGQLGDFGGTQSSERDFDNGTITANRERVAHNDEQIAVATRFRE